VGVSEAGAVSATAHETKDRGGTQWRGLRPASFRLVAKIQMSGENQKLDFQVNDQNYFVDLGENRDEWLVVVETPTGARSIPVYVDEAGSDDAVILVEDKRRGKIVN
jgi:hypothetical protein